MSSRTRSVVLVLVGVCLLTAGLQAGTYTWDGSWAQNWSDPAQWSTTSSGTPGPGDTVQFFCAYYPFNDCVNLDANRTVANVIVSTSNDPYALNILGSTTLTVTGSFTFNAVTGNGLLQTDNAPPYSFPLANGGKGFISCLLSGAGSVIVNSGTLDLQNTGNNFTGGIYVNGGYLTTDTRSTGYFGGNTIYLGDSAAGNTDAVLEPAGGSAVTYSNPIVVRAGNSGRAIITYSSYNGNDQDYTSDYYTSSLTYSGPITLNKDVTFLNNARGQNASDPLVIAGTVSGNFGVTVDGSSYTYLSGNNTYVGATTITGAAIAVLNGTSGTFLGPINVQDGVLYATSDAALGDPGNVLTLGTDHSIGGFGPYNANVTFTHAISLVGNGYLSATQTDGGNSSWGEFQGVISGAGRLIIGMQGVAGWKSTACFMKLDANNTYTGGTVVVAGAAGETSEAGAYDAYSNNTIFGAGDLTLKFGGAARITAPANVGGKVFVNDLGCGGGLIVAGDFMPAIDPSSSGTLMVGAGLGSTFAAALANASSPIGNGYMYLGSGEAYQYVPDAASFAALVANQTPAGDGSKTYFIGNSWASPDLHGGLNDFATAGGNQAMNVQIGKPGLWGEGNVSWVSLAGNGNDFSGTLTVACGSTLFSVSSTDMGIATGAVYLNGGSPATPHAGHTLVIDGNNSTTTKGDVYFNGSTGITFNLWSGADPVTFAAASYNRQNRGTISFRSETNTLGAGENATVTGAAPPVNNNMVAAYFWQCQDYVYGTGSNSFVTYGANGFAPVSVYLTSLAGSTASNIVYSPGEAVSGSESAYAIRAGGALTGSGTVTVGDGVNPAGVIFASAATHTANFAFGGSEGILYTPFNTVISGAISGTNGITKSGVGSLELQGNNVGLSGDITVNEGTLSSAMTTRQGRATSSSTAASYRPTARPAKRSPWGPTAASCRARSPETSWTRTP